MISGIPTLFESQYAAKCFLETEEVTNTLQLVAELLHRFEPPSASGRGSLCKASHQSMMMSAVWLSVVMLADSSDRVIAQTVVSRLVGVGFVVDNVTLPQSLQVLTFSPVSIITPALRTHLHPLIALMRKRNG
jgi:hypothetical protein